MKSILMLLSFILWSILILKKDFCEAASVQIVDMSKNWTLQNQNSSIKLSQIQIPSGVYSALYGESVLNSYNDVNLRWISYDNWTFSKEFYVDYKELENLQNVNLTFNGIDTIAEIRLNHYLLGRTDNMFVRYSYNVTKILAEQNILEVEIKSPVYAALEKANLLAAQNKSVPPDCPISRYHGECHMNMLRKMQASFSWDWGLAAPSMGIWKSVTLDKYEVALIRDIDVVTSRNATHWNMFVRVFIDAIGNKNFYAELKLYAVELLEEPIVIRKYAMKRLSVKSPMIAFEQAFPIDKVVPWWPNGYGDQKLYPLHFTLDAWLYWKKPSIVSKTKSQKTIQIGFRTIELVEDPAPAGDGNTFFFRVNDVDIFMKGTNYIPSHILPELSQDQERIKHLLYAAKDAHMNMIRVWGGGIYESDFFYSLADYFGLLIWQDMMFACAMYPVTEDFLASVRKEVQQNAKRIAYHPSIAIFATNNENEAALVGSWYHTKDDFERFANEYRELYVGNVLHELKIVEHSDRPNPLVSSPSNGKATVQDNYISDNPQSNFFGDVHFYSIFKNDWDPSLYPRPRFASEYGFQSLPQMQAWLRTKDPDDDLYELFDHRAHHPAGLNAMLSSIHENLPLPLPEDDNFLEAFIYLSQVSQAMSTKIETELYRSLRDTDHRTMGALYWQLNDIWVAPSWSGIDFYGNYKLLHYWAKDFMAPITITALYEKSSDSVNITLICDKLKVNTENLQVTMNYYLYSELFPKRSISWPVTLKPNGVQYDKIIPRSEILFKPCTSQNCFIEFLLQRGDSILAKTFYFPNYLKLADGIQDPNVKVDISSSYCNSLYNKPISTYSLTITVDHPAIFLYIEIVHEKIVKYKLSRNGYIQTAPIQVVHLEFQSSECIRLRSSHIKVLTINQYMSKRQT